MVWQEKKFRGSIISDESDDYSDHSTGCSRIPQYLAAIIINISTFSIGVVIGWPSPMIPILQSDDSPFDFESLTDNEVSWLGSLMCIGTLLAIPLFGYLVNNHSRKLIGYFMGFIEVAGWLVLIFAHSQIMLFLARLVLGFGAAGNMILCPLYVTEIASDNLRGTLGTLFSLFLNLGILFSYIVGSYVDYKIFSMVCLSMPIIFLFLFFWLPETSVFLLSRGKARLAQRTLKWLGREEDLPASETIVKVPEIMDDISNDSPSFKEVITSDGTIMGFVIGLGLMANNQLSGIFAIVSYTVIIFQESGSDISPNMSAIIVGALQVVGIYMTSVLVDRLGRKILLVTSNFFAAVGLGVLGLYTYLMEQGYDLSGMGFVPVTCLCVYVVAIGLGVGSVPFIMINEIFHPKVKGFAVMICLCLLNVLAFLVARFFVDMSSFLGQYGCFWFFAACCTTFIFFCAFVVPETKNKRLDSILKELNGEECNDDKENGDKTLKSLA